MTTKPLGVGIVGASPERGWALDAHLPALASLGHLYELQAVATSRPESAAAAQEKFKCKAYSDYRELCNDENVDVVVVSVKVPQHFELVSAALNANKRVICEWPLGNGTAEAIKLTELAASKGLGNVVGLQARSSPAFAFLRDLIREGKIGEVVSTSAIGAGSFPFGAAVPSFYSYLLDKANGATTLTIPFSHFTDALQFALGKEFVEVSANLAVMQDKVPLSSGGELPATAADQISVAGVLEGGVLATIAYRFYKSAGHQFVWEINGTKGDITVTAPSGHVQMSPLEIRASFDGQPMEKLEVPDKYYWVPESTPRGVPLNVAQAYVQAADDWAGKGPGRPHAPTFADALVQHRFVEAIEEAAKSGIKQIRGEDGSWRSCR